jgi:hypothetical protein
MKKSNIILKKLAKSNNKNQSRSHHDPRNGKSQDQITNGSEQEEVVNEPYVKTDRQEENKNETFENTEVLQKDNQADEINKKEESKAES